MHAEMVLQEFVMGKGNTERILGRLRGKGRECGETSKESLKRTRDFSNKEDKKGRSYEHKVNKSRRRRSLDFY